MSIVLCEEQENIAKTENEDMGQFLREICQYPRLSAQQERELAIACASGEEEAIKEMVNANLRLVVSVAKDYAGRGVPLLDLIQEGSIGLLVAARKFDYTLEYRFSTYATKWIRQCIGRYILNHSSLIRVPAHTLQQIRLVLSAKTALQQGSTQAPTTQMIAQKTGFPEKKVTQLLALWPEICSLDAPGSEDDGTLLLCLEDTQAPQPHQVLVRNELKRTMDSLLGTLNARQQQVLRLYFGMEDGICHSLEEIGGRLGISKERARQIQHQAMDKLRTIGADFGLEDFLT